MSDDDQLKTCKVGYKNPPTEKQFKKGQSGNPKGRPKGKEQSLRKQILKFSKKYVNVTIDGQQKKMSCDAALIYSVMMRGIKKSDPRVLQFLLKCDQENRKEEGAGFFPISTRMIETMLFGARL